MSKPFPVMIPLINPNEPEALLVALKMREGQRVGAGEVLCVLETTKSTFELSAESAGYILAISHQEGDTVKAGEILAYLSDQPEATIPPLQPISPAEASGVPASLRLTRPARELALARGVDLAALPRDRLVTEADVRSLLETTAEQSLAHSPAPQTEMDPQAILIYGGGGHAKMLIDLLRDGNHYRIAGILDDGMAPGTQIMGVPVLGGGELLAGLFTSGVRQAVNGVGGIGNVNVRVKIFDTLTRAGFSVPAVVHPAAFVEPSASLALGAQVFARAYIGGEARVGFGAIASTGCLISHDCILEEYAIISPGAILAGEVHIGRGALVGMGVTINLKVSIGAGAKIGNSATVKANVPERAIVQAGATWPAI
jgi:sugar O-acyltransferase (sialic acid O-acetyltransferase NeuD family)